jgi:hypothetical protein
MVIKIRVSCKRMDEAREYKDCEPDCSLYVAVRSISLSYRVDARLKCDDPDQSRSCRRICRVDQGSRVSR